MMDTTVDPSNTKNSTVVTGITAMDTTPPHDENDQLAPPHHTITNPQNSNSGTTIEAAFTVVSMESNNNIEIMDYKESRKHKKKKREKREKDKKHRDREHRDKDHDREHRGDRHGKEHRDKSERERDHHHSHSHNHHSTSASSSPSSLSTISASASPASCSSLSAGICVTGATATATSYPHNLKIRFLLSGVNIKVNFNNYKCVFQKLRK